MNDASTFSLTTTPAASTLRVLEHVTDSDFACWCHPDVYTPCACAGGCDACEGTGLRPVAVELAPVTPRPLVIVHRGAPLVVQ